MNIEEVTKQIGRAPLYWSLAIAIGATLGIFFRLVALKAARKEAEKIRTKQREELRADIAQAISDARTERPRESEHDDARYMPKT